MASVKLGGRPKSSIHRLYTRVEGDKSTDPLYECIGCGDPIKGKLLYKLCEHSSKCNDLNEAQAKIAVEAAEEQVNKKLQEQLTREKGSASDSSNASSKKRKGVGGKGSFCSCGFA
jgi:hypothetical protein